MLQHRAAFEAEDVPRAPRKQDNEFNQPLITGAISSPEEMEIVGFFPEFHSLLLAANWPFLGFFCRFGVCSVFFLCCSCVGSRRLADLEALDQDRVTLGALGSEIFGQREERQGELTLSW